MDIKRILTTVLGLPAVIAILVFGNTLVIDIFFGVVAVISIKEFYDAFEKGKTAKPIRWIGYLISASIAVLRMFHLESSLVTPDTEMINMMFALIVFALFVVFFHVLNSGMKRNVMDSAVTIFGIIYIPVLLIFLPMLRASKNGLFVIWYVIICGWATDIFAYLVGKFFGEKKHKFSRISPNKSIEGCIAGAVRSNDNIINLYCYMQYIFIYKYIIYIYYNYFISIKCNWASRRFCCI